MTRFDAEIEDILGPDVSSSESAFVGGAYDGADRMDQSMALWQPRLQSADGEILPEKKMLDARSRDIMRNDSYVRSGATLHQDNIVGSMFTLLSKPSRPVLGAGFDEAWQTEFQEEIEEKFTLWAESPENWSDASRNMTLTELVRMAVGLDVASGEVLATVEWLRDSNRPFNTAIQMVDTDRLCDPHYGLGRIRERGGVRKNSHGAPIGYYIRNAHPYDVHRWMESDWTYYRAYKPWGRPQVIHLFNKWRPEQTRGVSDMVSALQEMRMTKNFRKINLQNAVVNATYAASIESEMPSADVFASMGAGAGGADPIEGMQRYNSEYLNQINQYSGGAKNLKLDGVKIPHLYPGTKLKMHPAGDGGPLGTDFEASLIRYIAASLGVSYEQLSRDYSQTSYSSARASLQETYKTMQAKKRMVADRMAGFVYRLWLEEVVNKRMVEALPRRAKRDGWIYEGQNFDALARNQWIGASRGQIDELKETQAAILRLRHNLTTEEHEVSRLGMDWREVKRQRRREQVMTSDLQLESGGMDATAPKESLSADPNSTEQEAPADANDDE